MERWSQIGTQSHVVLSFLEPRTITGYLPGQQPVGRVRLRPLLRNADARMLLGEEFHAFSPGPASARCPVFLIVPLERDFQQSRAEISSAISRQSCTLWPYRSVRGRANEPRWRAPGDRRFAASDFIQGDAHHAHVITAAACPGVGCVGGLRHRHDCAGLGRHVNRWFAAQRGIVWAC